jgi:serine/threonine-protein kinase
LLLFVGNLWARWEDHDGAALLALLFNGIAWLVEAVYVALLWGSRPLSLRVLRILETVLFAMLMIGYAGYICLPYRLGSLLQYANLKGVDGSISALAAAVALPGFALVVIYGIFIPNTARRCANVVASMSLFPLLVMAIFGLAENNLDVELLVRFLVQTALLLAFAAAIAIYGSHRFETLRQEVLAARQFGQYQLKGLIGQGGMGEVHLAEHLLLLRPCALKLIRAELTNDPQAPIHFEREVRAMAGLTHPNTVEIFDYGHTAEGTFYYVMEYLPGLSLEQLVDRYGPLEPGRAVHLLRQVCAALEEAHGVGLIHRDIKPSNVLVCERGGIPDVAKLLDFGMVRALAPNRDGQASTADHASGCPVSEPLPLPSSWEKMPSGTPDFMSPEQARGVENLGATTDVYSLGATAYFLLTGKPPFAKGQTTQVLDALLTQPAPPLTNLRPDFPDDLQKVILRCLEKEPARRYPDVIQVEQALTSCACANDWTRQRAHQWWCEFHTRQALTGKSGT